MARAVGDEPGWDSTRDAEPIALTQLQADALVTVDAGPASAASAMVATARLEDLL